MPAQNQRTVHAGSHLIQIGDRFSGSRSLCGEAHQKVLFPAGDTRVRTAKRDILASVRKQKNERRKLLNFFLVKDLFEMRDLRPSEARSEDHLLE